MQTEVAAPRLSSWRQWIGIPRSPDQTYKDADASILLLINIKISLVLFICLSSLEQEEKKKGISYSRSFLLSKRIRKKDGKKLKK